METGPDLQKLTVVTSEPLDQKLLEQLTSNLGEITLYSQGFDFGTGQPSSASAAKNSPDFSGMDEQKNADGSTSGNSNRHSPRRGRSG